MTLPPVTEGEIAFHVPDAGKYCKTWYKIVGDLATATQRPLVTLHGGPGAAHDYISPLGGLAASRGIPVIFYDQLGIGRSTHLPEKNGEGAFWTEALFCDELDNLLKHLGIQSDYDLYGHSWGGMLAARFAARQPKGLKHLIISDSPASMELWVQAANRLRTQLPQDVQNALTKHEENGTTHEKEYEDAVGKFYARFCCRLDPWPEDVKATFAAITEDPTVYYTMNGPSEFYIIGTLKTWSVIDELHKINVPALLLNGRYDEAQDEVVEPFFRLIPKSKWVQFAESSHMPQWEETERYLEVLGSFLITHA